MLAPAPPGLLVKAALGLRRLLQLAADRVVPSELAVLDRASGAAATSLLAAVARHRIADLIEHGPLGAERIAELTGTRADVIHRMLRALATAGMFELLPDGRFRNNRSSRALARSPGLADFCAYFGSRANVLAWLALEQTLERGESGFECVHGRSIWDHFQENPSEAQTFASAMSGITRRHAPVVAAIYPFAGVERLCDVGGGTGVLLAVLLGRHRELRGVLYDAPDVVESARALFEERRLHDRVELIGGNFFESVPAGCDTYLMKNVLHDWDDARARAILATCRRAMGKDAKLLVVETITDKNSRQGLGPLSDIQMMMTCSGGRERDENDYLELLFSEGLCVARIYRHPIIDVIEARSVL